MRLATLVLAGLAAVAWCVAPARVAAETLFGLTDLGELFASTDGGTTWIAHATLPVDDAVSLVAGATVSDLFLASRAGSVHRSSDAGSSWTAVSAVAASDVTALVPHPGRLLLFTRSGSVFQSTDAGVTFVGTGAIAASDIVSAASLSPWAFALTASGAIYRSADDGASWNAIGTLTVSNAVGIAAYAGRLYVLTGTGDLARSEDLGASWSFIAALSQSGMTALLGATELIAGMGTGEVAGSADGLGWSWRGAIHQMTVRSLATDQPHPTSVGLPERPVALSFAIGPTPAAGPVHLSFDLGREASVRVTVHDVAGRIVAQPLAEQRLAAGVSTRRWSPELPARGVYLVRVTAGDRTLTRRLIWLGGR